MSPLLAVSLFALASGSGGNLICRKMGMPRGWRRLLTLACTLVPPAGYLVLGGTAALRGAVKAVRRGLAGGKKRTDEREDALRRMTPAERGMFLRREGMKEMKADLERSGARLDAARLRALARKERLLGRPGWDESSLFQDRLYCHLVAWEGRAAGAFAKDRERLQQYMMTTSVRERDTSQRVFSIRCNHLADGTLTFELPYDAGAEVLNEIRLVLARDWGVELGDYFRARVSEHPSNDFRCIGLGEVRTGMIHDTADYSVFVYDRGKGTVCPAGERLSPEIEKKVWKTMDDFKSVSKGLAGREGILFDRGRTRRRHPSQRGRRPRRGPEDAEGGEPSERAAEGLLQLRGMGEPGGGSCPVRRQFPPRGHGPGKKGGEGTVQGKADSIREEGSRDAGKETEERHEAALGRTTFSLSSRQSNKRQFKEARKE